MSMAKSLASHNSLITASRRLHENPSHRFQPIPVLPFPKHNHERIDFEFLAGNQRLTLMIRPRRSDLLSVQASVPPAGVPPPPAAGPPPSSWKNWVIGILVTMIIPLFMTKGGPLKLIMQKMDHVVETTEEIVEAVELVAEKVDKVAEDIEKKLPSGGGGKLQEALDFIENVAEKVDKEAHVADDFIDKVEEMEEKVESIIEPVLDEAKEKEKEINAQQVKKSSRL